jgi:hypothetical protein
MGFEPAIPAIERTHALDGTATGTGDRIGPLPQAFRFIRQAALCKSAAREKYVLWLTYGLSQLLLPNQR